MNKHTTTVHTRCPYSPIWDYYKVTFSTNKFVKTEDLEDACEKIRGKEVTQEKVAMLLRKSVPKCVAIKVVGRHGANCQTEVTQ